MNPLDDIHSKLMFVLNELKDFYMLSKNLIERSSYSSDLILVKQVDDLGKTLAKVITLGKSITKMLIPNNKQFVEHDQDKNVLTNQRSKVTTSEEDKPHFDMTAPEGSHNQDVGEIPDEVSTNKLQDSSTTSHIEPIFIVNVAERSPIEILSLAQNYISDLTTGKQINHVGKRFAKAMTLGESIAKMLIPEQHNQNKDVLLDQRPKVTTSEEDEPHFDLTSSRPSHNQAVGEISNEDSMNEQQDFSTTSHIEPIFDEETAEASAIEMHNLVRNLLSKGLHKTAKTLCEETINKMQMSSGSKENNLSIANAKSTLSIIYWSTKEYEEVLKILIEVLVIRKRELGKNHLTVALTLNNLAAYYAKVGNYCEAQQLCFAAWKIKFVHLGSRHPQVSTQFYRLGVIHQMIGEYGRAAESYEKALCIYTTGFKDVGPGIIKIQIILHLMGCYLKQGKFKEAKAVYEWMETKNEND